MQVLCRVVGSVLEELVEGDSPRVLRNLHQQTTEIEESRALETEQQYRQVMRLRSHNTSKYMQACSNKVRVQAAAVYLHHCAQVHLKPAG